MLAMGSAQTPMSAGADHPWATGPTHARLAEGAVHVWRADLTAVKDELGQLLCGDERARAEGILDERHRRLWSRSRGVLRALLGGYLQSDPSTLRFASGAHGKPELPDTRLSFNLSHSGQLALYAITEMGSIGVDIEVTRRAIDEVALASRMFGSAEARRLAELDPVSRKQEFLGAWTRNEAKVKCRGTGIGNASADTRELWVADLEVGSGAAAALALERPARELCCWDWPPARGALG
jgi:4'-phosphopantetheinyl transferase